MRVEDIVGRPLRLFGTKRSHVTREVFALLQQVGLSRTVADRYPRELSGGEKQRVALARALAPQPKLLICDEVTSSLDVCVQANILALLNDLRTELQMSILFISHDIALVGAVSDSVIVLKRGQLVERGSNQEVLERPAHEYARKLLSAVPRLPPGDYPWR